jgi:putative SOS response-associated peptidase YedK
MSAGGARQVDRVSNSRAPRFWRYPAPMCNLYSLIRKAAIREWFRTRRDRAGNLSLFRGISPGQTSPIVRTEADGERELVMARWGTPGSPQYAGPHLRGWLDARP